MVRWGLVGVCFGLVLFLFLFPALFSVLVPVLFFPVFFKMRWQMGKNAFIRSGREDAHRLNTHAITITGDPS